MRIIFCIGITFLFSLTIKAQNIHIDSLVETLKKEAVRTEKKIHQLVLVSTPDCMTTYNIKVDVWGVATIYKHTAYSYGDYYFKNGSAITKFIFINETMKEETVKEVQK